MMRFQVTRMTKVVTTDKHGDELEYYRYSLKFDGQTSMTLRLPSEDFQVGQWVEVNSE
jgi:hypothetical protein